jgi:hypothetical protein
MLGEDRACANSRLLIVQLIHPNSRDIFASLYETILTTHDSFSNYIMVSIPKLLQVAAECSNFLPPHIKRKLTKKYQNHTHNSFSNC